MKKWTIVVLTVSISICLFAQKSQKAIALNHLYIVVDTTTYQYICNNHWVATILGDTNTRSTVTSTDAWTGKYLYGKNSYLEIFSSNSYAGAVLGDAGLGFITMQQNDLYKWKQYWEQHYKDSVIVDTATKIVNNAKQPWYYSISLYDTDTTQKMYSWLMENTAEELALAGFTAKEMMQPIPWHSYREKRTKKIFAKAFDRITAVTITLTAKEYTTLQKTLLGLGFVQHKQSFYNTNVTIHCQIKPFTTIHIVNIKMQLLHYYKAQIHIVSPNCVLQVKGNAAFFSFK
jgi:Family of unknown function (DUF5829)